MTILGMTTGAAARGDRFGIRLFSSCYLALEPLPTAVVSGFRLRTGSILSCGLLAFRIEESSSFDQLIWAVLFGCRGGGNFLFAQLGGNKALNLQGSFEDTASSDEV